VVRIHRVVWTLTVNKSEEQSLPGLTCCLYSTGWGTVRAVHKRKEKSLPGLTWWSCWLLRSWWYW